MKQLILFRHAKSESHDARKTDHERSITPRGEHDAKTVAEQLSARAMVPDLILSSDSMRARQTAQAACDQWTADPEITYLPRLYSAGVREIVEAVAVHGGTAKCVMVIGHNPTMEELASLTAGRHIRLKTSAAAILNAGVTTWADLRHHSLLQFEDVIDRPQS